MIDSTAGGEPGWCSNLSYDDSVVKIQLSSSLWYNQRCFHYIVRLSLLGKSVWVFVISVDLLNQWVINHFFTSSRLRWYPVSCESTWGSLMVQTISVFFPLDVIFMRPCRLQWHSQCRVRSSLTSINCMDICTSSCLPAKSVSCNSASNWASSMFALLVFLLDRLHWHLYLVLPSCQERVLQQCIELSVEHVCIACLS